MKKSVRWNSWDGNGIEHCIITIDAGGIVIEGVVAGNREGDYGAWYCVVTDEAFRTRDVRVKYVSGPEMHVMSDENGIWHDALNGNKLVELQGCSDVDISFTPATNMLPLKRMKLTAGDTRAIQVAYIPLPGEIKGNFLPVSVSQRYTCLELNRAYRYEGIFRNFTADLYIDDMGIVEDYPGLFHRCKG